MKHIKEEPRIKYNKRYKSRYINTNTVDQSKRYDYYSIFNMYCNLHNAQQHMQTSETGGAFRLEERVPRMQEDIHAMPSIS